MTNANVKQAVPFLSVANMQASLHFYVDGLGFTVKNSWIPDDHQTDYPPDGRIRWCWLELGEAAIMLQEAIAGRQSSDKMGIGITICFQCEDALVLYRGFKSREIKTINCPFVGNRMWVVPLSDPDGYRLEFSSPTNAPEDSKLQG